MHDGPALCTQSNADRGGFSFPSGWVVLLLWSLGLTLLCIFWAASAPYISESNGGGVLHVLALLIAWPLLSGLLIARWGGPSIGRLALSAIVVAATLVGLILVWRAEIEGLGQLLHRFPPARPMFSNDFVDDERTLLPYWYSAVSITDEFGHWAWADHDDNLLMVVITGVPKQARFGALTSGLSECVVRVGDDREDQFVTLERFRNALVVVLPDGSLARFDLGDGLAKQFYSAHRSKVVANVLRAAGQLLDPQEKRAFDDFLVSYREPKSLKPPKD